MTILKIINWIKTEVFQWKKCWSCKKSRPFFMFGNSENAHIKRFQQGKNYSCKLCVKKHPEKFTDLHLIAKRKREEKLKQQNSCQN